MDENELFSFPPEDMADPGLEGRQASWYEQWFDSPYYHLLYKNRNETEARFFIDNLAQKLDLPKGSKLLDLACGKGRHSIYLNSLGYTVTGIDLSEESIREAKKAENETLHFFVHDMRELYWAQHFDCVLNLFTSFGYFDDEKDNFKTLQSVYDSLKPGGMLVIDFMNVDKTQRELVSAEIITVNETEFHINREIKEGFIIKKIEVRDGGTVQHFMEKVKLLKQDDFERYLGGTGFIILNTFGNYSLTDFDAASAERLIIVAKRRN